MNSLIEIREYKPEDKAFVMATFLRGLYYGNEFFNLIPKDIFMENYKRAAEVLIASPSTIVEVACLKDDKDVVLGYSILSTDFQTVHFVYLKSAWRKQGISKALLPQYPTAFTHFTTSGLHLAKKFKNCVFNPFKI